MPTSGQSALIYVISWMLSDGKEMKAVYNFITCYNSRTLDRREKIATFDKNVGAAWCLNHEKHFNSNKIVLIISVHFKQKTHHFLCSSPPVSLLLFVG